MNYAIKSENYEIDFLLRKRIELAAEDFLSNDPLISFINIFIKYEEDRKFKIDVIAHYWHKDFHYTEKGPDLYRTVVTAQKQLLNEISNNKKKYFKLRKRNFRANEQQLNF